MLEKHKEEIEKLNEEEIQTEIEDEQMVRSRFNCTFSPYDFLFLSRAGFNGMMRFGSKGNWNIPFCKKPERFSQSYITKITNQVDAVSKIIKPDPEWTFVNGSFEDVIIRAVKKILFIVTLLILDDTLTTTMAGGRVTSNAYSSF